MKKLRILVISIILVFFMVSCASKVRLTPEDYMKRAAKVGAATKMYGRITLTGGTKSVDNIPYANLVDGDLCITVNSSKNLYFHRFESSSSAGESPPDIITPDDQTGNGRWELVPVVWSAGDCADGACLDGSSDGGTWLRLYDGDSHYLEINPGDLAANEIFDPTDYTGTSSWVRKASPTFQTNFFTPQMTLVGSDASPDAAGEMRYDFTIAGMSGGGLRWFDDDSVRLLVDLETDPSDDDFVVAYDSAADGFYMKADADTGGATALDDITDPDAASSWTMGAHTLTLTSGTEAWAGMIIESTDADNAGDTTLLTLAHYDDFDTNSVFLHAINDSDAGADTIFKVTGLGVYIGDGAAIQTMTGDDLNVTGHIAAGGPIYATGGIVSSAALPKITLDDSGGADGYWDVNAADADDAVATFGVDDSNGDDQPYIELDGVNERIETKYPVAIEVGGTVTGELLLDDESQLAIDATPDGMDDDEYNGIIIAGADCGENLAQWDTVFINNDVDIWHKADATQASGEYPAGGIAVAACTDTNPAKVMIRGAIRNEGWTGLTIGGAVYLGEADGGLTQTAPSTANDCVQIIGFAISDSEILFDFSRPYQLVE